MKAITDAELAGLADGEETIGEERQASLCRELIAARAALGAGFVLSFLATPPRGRGDRALSVSFAVRLKEAYAARGIDLCDEAQRHSALEAEMLANALAVVAKAKP